MTDTVDKLGRGAVMVVVPFCGATTAILAGFFLLQRYIDFELIFPTAAICLAPSLTYGCVVNWWTWRRSSPTSLDICVQLLAASAVTICFAIFAIAIISTLSVLHGFGPGN